MDLIEAAICCPRCIISVMGDHAGEGTNAIFSRKIADIGRVGKTFWLFRSPKAQPIDVQQLCECTPVYAIFVDPATKGGARPTICQDKASEYSENGKDWHSLPNGISPVTGKLGNRVTALVFDTITPSVNGLLDLWNYCEFSDIKRPVRFILGCSTVCAIQKDMRLHPDKMSSRYRRIVAVARLVKPYCVRLR